MDTQYRPHVKPIWGILVAVLVTLLSASSAWAQTIRGLLVEEGSETPVGGVFVVMLSEAGLEVDRVLTDDRGRFSVIARGPGSYSLRTERIGYASTETPLIELDVAAVHELRLEVPVEAIELIGVRVEAERRCVVRPEEGVETARIWGEAEKALSATRWTGEQRLFVFETESYEQVRSPQTLVVLSEASEKVWRTVAKPFITPPAEQLVELGFVRTTAEDSTYYYAPDAEVMLSDAFLDAHCFRVRLGDDQETGLVGLAFEPVPGSHMTDVKGVLWLDEETAALRFLEYSYTGLDVDFSTEHFGGRLEFEQLPTGAWIIRNWWIRGPIVRRGGVGHLQTERLAAVKQVGGRVISLRPAIGFRN
jgi:hypothetical protein